MKPITSQDLQNTFPDYNHDTALTKLTDKFFEGTQVESNDTTKRLIGIKGSRYFFVALPEVVKASQE